MDEALQNVTDYIQTEADALGREQYVALLHAIKDYCDLCIDASDEMDEDDEDEDDSEEE